MFRDTHHGKPCVYCLRQMSRADFFLQPTRDHVWPVSRGGGRHGIAVCCLTCNGLKGDMLPDEWHAWMAANPRWWTLSKAERRERRRIAERLRGVPDARGNVILPRRGLQGTAPSPPVVVPPELIFTSEETS